MTWEPSVTIYRIVCFATGEVYVGATGCYKDRVRTHRRQLREGRHPNWQLQRAYTEYGVNAFYFEVIEEVARSLGDEREIFWVNHYDSYFKGFNLTFGGNKRYGIPWEIEQVRLRKITEATKNAV